MNKKKLSRFERYLSEEIGIEFKACLYFFCILFFYCMYKLVNGITEASIFHMGEMIITTYIMGYIQVYLLANFDEAEELKIKEIFFMILGSIIYTFISILGNWFEKNIVVSILFLCYMMLAYICAFLVYKFKRKIDGKILNEDLKLFQERRLKDEESNRHM